MKSKNAEKIFDRLHCNDACISRLRIGIHAHSHPDNIA
jgi:hypothetical protein